MFGSSQGGGVVAAFLAQGFVVAVDAVHVEVRVLVDRAFSVECCFLVYQWPQPQNSSGINRHGALSYQNKIK